MSILKIQSIITSAFAAISAAAILVSASVGPAVNAASFVA
jgi:hypothetical protein